MGIESPIIEVTPSQEGMDEVVVLVDEILNMDITPENGEQICAKLTELATKTDSIKASPEGIENAIKELDGVGTLISKKKNDIGVDIPANLRMKLSLTFNKTLGHIRSRTYELGTALTASLREKGGMGK